MELTGPGLATAVMTWSVVIAFDVFLTLLILRVGISVWRQLKNSK